MLRRLAGRLPRGVRTTKLAAGRRSYGEEHEAAALFRSASAIPTPLLFNSTRIRHSPFSGKFVTQGVTDWTVYNRTLLPIQGPDNGVEDYWKLVSGAVLWDVSAQRQVELRGPDAARLAQYISTRDLRKFKSGQAKYVICADDTGAVINDPLVLKLDSCRYWFSIADRDLELWAKAHAFHLGLDVSVRELTNVPVLALQGPKSPAILRKVLGAEAVDGLKFFTHRFAHWRGRRVLVLRAGWSPEVGYEVYILPEETEQSGESNEDITSELADDMWRDILSAGEKYGIGFGGPNQPRRIEGGMISSCDYSATTPPLNALELGLPKHFVNLDMNQEFSGKAALKALVAAAPVQEESGAPSDSLAARNPGANRLLVGVRFLNDDSPDFDLPMADPWPIEDAEGNVIGHATSIARSPRIGARICIATIRADLADAGTRLVVRPPGRHPHEVETVQFPLPGTEATEPLLHDDD